ncbi:MAG TPA: DUF4058 family protein [Phycisphaerae bacterium]|jgi:hypothetical protein
MPIHDWSRADHGVFHHFHQAWTIEIAHALNGGKLPPDYFAMAEQVVSGPIPDVVTLQRRRTPADRGEPAGGVAVEKAPPQARHITSAEPDRYARKANRIVIRHRLGRVVAVIEIASPGNKCSSHALRSFTERAAELLRQEISLLIVDLFPPAPRDPQGIHKAIWDEFADQPFELPADKPLTVAAYCAGETKTATSNPWRSATFCPSHPFFSTSTPTSSFRSSPPIRRPGTSVRAPCGRR